MSKPKRKFKYDNNEGLMLEISKLTAPPSPDLPTSSRREQNDAKKAEAEVWKNAEAQTCSYCFTGGNILCCEGCPASFHLACLAIDEKDVPEGVWLCNRCQNMPPSLRNSVSQSSSSSVVPLNPAIREEREKQRNDDAFRIHLNRETEKSPKSVEWPNKALLNALSKTNPMEFQLPPTYEKEQKSFPYDNREKAREDIFNEICCHCKTKNPYSVMLKCDFCPNKWHMGCVDPPLTVKPTWRVWMCPMHVENIAEDVQGFRIMAASKREEFWNSIKDIDLDQEAIVEMWKKFCESATEHRKSIFMAKYTKSREKTKALTTPFSYDLPSTSNGLISIGDSDEIYIETCVNRMLKLKAAKITERRLSRNKKAALLKEKFIDTAYDFEFMKRRVRRSKSPEYEVADPELDEMDKMRSIPMSKDEVFQSIFSANPERRRQQYERALPDETLENMKTLARMNDTIIDKNKMIAHFTDEQEIINRNWHSLDINEGIRGGSVNDYHPKQRSKEEKGRRRILADSDMQLVAHGYGNGQNTRRMSSFATEMFFTRCPPPAPANHFPSPTSLRHVLLCSRRATTEFGAAFRVHPTPELLKNLVVIMYDHSFNTEDERNQFRVSSMSFWSKESFQAVMEKCRPYYGAFDPELEIKEEKVDGEYNKAEEAAVNIPDGQAQTISGEKSSNTNVLETNGVDQSQNGVEHNQNGSQNSKYPSEFQSPSFDDRDEAEDDVNEPGPSEPSCSSDVQMNGEAENSFVYDDQTPKRCGAMNKKHLNDGSIQPIFEPMVKLLEDEPTSSKSIVPEHIEFDVLDDVVSSSNSCYNSESVGMTRESDDIAPNSVSSSVFSSEQSSSTVVETNSNVSERKSSDFSVNSVLECSSYSRSSSTSFSTPNPLANGTRRYSNTEEFQSGPLNIKDLINRKNRSLSPVPSPLTKKASKKWEPLSKRKNKTNKKEKLADRTFTEEHLQQIFTREEEAHNREILKERQIENGMHVADNGNPSSSSSVQPSAGVEEERLRDGEMENGRDGSPVIDGPSSSSFKDLNLNTEEPSTSTQNMSSDSTPVVRIDVKGITDSNTNSTLSVLRSQTPWQLRDHDYAAYPPAGMDFSCYDFEIVVEEKEKEKEPETPVPKSVGRKRGRPVGSKNKKSPDWEEMKVVEVPVIKKRGRPKGSQTKKKNGRLLRGRKVDVMVEDDPSSPEVQIISPKPEEEEPVAVTEERIRQWRLDAEAIRAEYAPKVIARSNEAMKADYFKARDEAVQMWTPTHWEQLVKRCYDDRYNSLIPFDTRFFLPDVTVCAVLEVVSITHKLNLLPFAIQRGLTKIGSAADCHVLVDRLAKNYCCGIDDYHCDIVFDKLSKKFYLSTLGKSRVIVNGVVVYRKKLTATEESLRLRTIGKRQKGEQKIVCHCDEEILKLKQVQTHEKKIVDDGVIALKSGSTIRIGCVELKISFSHR